MSTTPVSPDVQKMIEEAVKEALANQPKGLSWNAIRTNKYFVLATSSLAGALGSSLFEAAKNHAFVWNAGSIKAIVTSALGVTVASLYHLYLTPASTNENNT